MMRAFVLSGGASVGAINGSFIAFRPPPKRNLSRSDKNL